MRTLGENKLNTKKDVLWKLDSTDLWSWFYLAYDDYDLAKTAARHAGGSWDWHPAEISELRRDSMTYWSHKQEAHELMSELLHHFGPVCNIFTTIRRAEVWLRLQTVNNPAETFDLEPLLIMNTFKKAPSVWKNSSSVKCVMRLLQFFAGSVWNISICGRDSSYIRAALRMNMTFHKNHQQVSVWLFFTRYDFGGSLLMGAVANKN